MVERWATESELARLIRVVCFEYKVPPPAEIRFGTSLVAHCDFPKGGRIVLPTVERVRRYRAIENPVLYRALALHEVSHWLIRKMGGKSGHSVDFYAQLFTLCEKYDLPLDVVLADEKTYKPRNAPRGFKAYLAGQNAGGQQAWPKPSLTPQDSLG